jgi:hypothetical protein
MDATSPASSAATLTVIALLPLVAWSIWRRVKRLVGRQPLSRVRPWVTLLLFPPMLAMLAATAFVPPHPQPLRLAWLGAGLVLGGAVGVWGLKRTRFDASGASGASLFYTPDSRIGIAISALFIARLVYRLADLAIHGPPPPQDTSFALSPFTLGPLGLLSGYFMIYAAGLVRQRRRMLRGLANKPPNLN